MSLLVWLKICGWNKKGCYNNLRLGGQISLGVNKLILKEIFVKNHILSVDYLCGYFNIIKRPFSYRIKE